MPSEGYGKQEISAPCCINVIAARRYFFKYCQYRGGGMSDDEKARAGLFREIFAEQLKVVELEARVTTQPLDYVTGFDHLAEVSKTTAELHQMIKQHHERLLALRSKVKLEDVSS
jgi:hypothetical protein